MNRWLRVTVRSTAATGLRSPDVFYFGNLVGETGDAGSPLAVNAIDLAVVRGRMGQPASITDPADFNRDGRVDAIDLGIAQANLLHRLPGKI